MLSVKKILNKIIVLIAVFICAISVSHGAGQKQQVVWEPAAGGWFDHDARLESRGVKEIKQLADECGIDFKLVYKSEDDPPEWFSSESLYELLKALDYAVTHWFSFRENKITASGKWKGKIPNDAMLTVEENMVSTYDSNLADMLSMVLCYVFSESKLDAKSRDYVTLRLLWVNEQMLPAGMSFNWVERYQLLKEKTEKWSRIGREKYTEVVGKRDQQLITDLMKKNKDHFVDEEDVDLVALHGLLPPHVDNEILRDRDMVMIWDALICKYGIKKEPGKIKFLPRAFSEPISDPLFEFYFKGLFKVELFDEEIKRWQKALATGWRQRFIVERQTRKHDIPETEWSWLPSVVAFEFPEVPDIVEIPSRDLLSVNQVQDGEDMEVGEQSPPSPDADEVEREESEEREVTLRTFEESTLR